MQMRSKPNVIKCRSHLLVCFKSINSNMNKNIVIFSTPRRKCAGLKLAYSHRSAEQERSRRFFTSFPPPGTPATRCPETARFRIPYFLTVWIVAGALHRANVKVEINTRRPWKVYKWRNVAATGYSSYDVTIACSGHCCLSGGGVL